MRLLNDIKTNGAMQMAIDEAILTNCIKNKIPCLRFFEWEPSCVTIGFFQAIKKEVDLEKAKSEGIDVVRRYTGGGAVFHDKELTYSIFLPEEMVGRDILDSYDLICGGIIKGFEKLGIKAEFKAINDIIVNGKKISGNAQTRRNNWVLQHGTILLDVDVEKMFSLLKVPDEKIRDKLIQVVKERVTSIRHEGYNFSFKDIKEALVFGFSELFGEFEQSLLTKEEVELSEKLVKEKYSTNEWNFKR